MELSELELSEKSDYETFSQYNSFDLTNYTDFNENFKSIFSLQINPNNKIEQELNSSSLYPIEIKSPSKKIKYKKKQKSFLRLFICGSCLKIYKSKENTLLHYKNVHLKEKPYICSYCNVGFAHRNGKLYHERKFHTKYFPYECPLSKFDYLYI
jgi:hypothetical protein